MDRYPYFKYTILLGATRALAHIGINFTHRVFGLSAPTDDALFQPELGWSVWGSLGWTKTADGLNWRMLDRFGLG